MLFSYKAIAKDGHSVNGTAEATDRQALLALLRRQDLHPLVVDSARTKALTKSLFGPSKKIKLGDLVIFTRQLSTMISAGVPLARSLSALGDNAENPYMREVLTGITKDIEGGSTLADAFAKYPKIFSSVYINMVRAGEEGGILDEILKRLALQVEQDASIRKKIRGAMAYPVVILSVTVIAFFVVMLAIVPKLSTILTSLGGPNAKLPIYTQIMLNVSDFCVKPTILGGLPIPIINKLPNLIILSAVAAVGVFFLLRYIRTPEGKYKFHYLLLRIPVVKTIILKIAVARFSRTFASLMGSGVSVLDALDTTGAALGNLVIERELKEAAENVRNGKPLSQPISQSKYFPPIVAQMLIVGEETGQVDTVLVKIADFYEEEVGVMIDSLSAIIEPVIIIVLGAAVGLIAASVMGPIANLSKNIGS